MKEKGATYDYILYNRKPRHNKGTYMQKFEELSNRQQQEKLVELERYTVQLIRDECGGVLWCESNAGLPTRPLHRGTTPNRLDSGR